MKRLSLLTALLFMLMSSLAHGQKGPDAPGVSSASTLEFRYLPQLDEGTWIIRPTSNSNGTPPTNTGYEDIIDSKTGKSLTSKELDERVFSQPSFLNGSKLKPNSRADLANGKPIIYFEFQDASKEDFKDFTATHIGKRLAIFVDHKLLSAPVINDVIPGMGYIEGNFTPDSAKSLADRLNAGVTGKAPTPLDPKARSIATIIIAVIGVSLLLLLVISWFTASGRRARLQNHLPEDDRNL